MSEQVVLPLCVRHLYCSTAVVPLAVSSMRVDRRSPRSSGLFWQNCHDPETSAYVIIVINWS